MRVISSYCSRYSRKIMWCLTKKENNEKLSWLSRSENTFVSFQSRYPCFAVTQRDQRKIRSIEKSISGRRLCSNGTRKARISMRTITLSLREIRCLWGFRRWTLGLATGGKVTRKVSWHDIASSCLAYNFTVHGKFKEPPRLNIQSPVKISLP